MKHAEDIADPRVIKALSHPLRAQILGMLNGTVHSPKEIARELSEPLGNVSYHVRTLADLGLIELVKKVPRRGAIEHYYRAPESESRLNTVALRVDEAGRKKLAEELAKFLERAKEIGAAGARDAADVRLVLGLFELPRGNTQ